MPKTKRDEKEGKSSQPRKRLHLDVLFDQEARQLLEDYSQDELNRLYEKVIDLEEELLHKLEYDEGVADILGAKIEEGRMWFLVQWDNSDKSFVPSATLKKIAPHKLMKYYESRLQFLQTPPDPNAPVGLNSLIKSSEPLVEQPKPKPKTVPPPKTVPQPNKPQPPRPQPGTGSLPPKRLRTMNCQGCHILLQYPEGTKIIRCPKCSSTMAAQH